MIPLEGKGVLVVGLAESGSAAAAVLARLGSRVVVVDRSQAPSRADARFDLEKMGVQVRLGVEVPHDIDGFDLLVASPGVPDRSPVLVAARKAGVEVISELELGYNLIQNTMVAVTGTNGKTTTTRLLTAILDSSRRHAFECGNIGTPLVSLYGRLNSDDVLVVEVSSFQLANIRDFRAKVSVCLNLAPDHFDWHEDIGDYRSAKMKLIENAVDSDFLIYNQEDEFCREMAGAARAVTAGFSASRTDSSLYIESGWIRSKYPLPEARVLEIKQVQIRGRHNLENVMAAVGAALALGTDPEKIRGAVASFRGLEHRLEYVDTVRGVSFYNDSKATNPHASLNALRAFDEPLVVILGGRNKGLEFHELAEELAARGRDGQLRGIVLFGESAREIEGALDGACRGGVEAQVLSNLEEALSTAFHMAGGEGSVLFSPGCASFDMFLDYAERGRAFKRLVSELKGSR